MRGWGFKRDNISIRVVSECVMTFKSIIGERQQRSWLKGCVARWQEVIMLYNRLVAHKTISFAHAKGVGYGLSSRRERLCVVSRR